MANLANLYKLVYLFHMAKVENYFFYTSQTIYIVEKQAKRRNTFVLIVSPLHK